MNVITEHYAHGYGPNVEVGLTIRSSKSHLDDYRKEFDARITMTVDDAKEALEALPKDYAAFEKAMPDGSRLRIDCELYEGFWMTWRDGHGKEVREPFLFGEDGWSERFAEAIDRGIKEALL